jgi:Pyridoxamine 5'-phosphate oxidase
MNWAAFSQAAPELAEFGRSRFTARNLAHLGTLRPDGTPRISPLRPFFLGDELVIGLMRSPKAGDLRRDPRCTLHTAVAELDGSEGEFKLYGRAVTVTDPAIVGAEDGWWSGRDPVEYSLYALDIDEAVGISWDAGAGQMRTTRWTPAGVVERERPYP